MHRLLESQLRQFIGEPERLPASLRGFVAAVDEAYRSAESDRTRLERSLNSISIEMESRYEELHDALSGSQRAERRLRDALATLTATFESTTDGLVVVDGQGALSRWNQKLLTILDLRDDATFESGASFAESFAGLLNESDLLVRRIAELAGRPDDESFDTLHTRDGRELEVYSQPQRIDGTLVGRVWSFRDVSARVKLEERVRHSHRIEAVGQLAGGVAHDFNNLLTVICSTCDFIAQGLPAGSPMLEEVAEIQSAADRAVQLTRQLLSFSRRHVIQPVRVDMGRLVDRLRPMLGRLIGEEFELCAAVDADLDSVYVDPGQLEQVIVNLVVNARDAMPRGGKIEIIAVNEEVRADTALRPAEGVVVPGPHVRLSVRDGGTGIPASILPRIFEPFFTSKEAGRGTGLGLATVSSIVREAHGNVVVDSAPGTGTTFSIYLPVASDADVASTGPRGLSRSLHGTETILVAEDDERVRAVVHRTLRMHNYNVIVTRNGNAALQLILESDTKVDLVISDVVMPGLSGLELRECLRELRPEVKVLLASGYTNLEIGRRANLPADTRIIQKPFAGPELLAAVRNLLDHHAAEADSVPASATECAA